MFFTTQRKPVGLGPLIGVGAIVTTLGGLAGAGIYLLNRKGLVLRDLLRREPPESPEGPESSGD